MVSLTGEKKDTIIDSMKSEIRVLKGKSGRIRTVFPYNPIFVEKGKVIKKGDRIGQ